MNFPKMKQRESEMVGLNRGGWGLFGKYPNLGESAHAYYIKYTKVKLPV